MKTQTQHIELETKRQFELIDVTARVQECLQASGVTQGLVVVYNPHTTASIRLNHNEPLLIQDIMKTLFRLIPVDANYSHDLFELREQTAINERSNGHAHVKAFMMGASETIPVVNGKLSLGSKQSIFFVEFDGGRKRDFIVTVFGE
jgi:secondary thiamine-phosphate synthase enzyme